MKHYELLTLVSGKYAEHELEPVTTLIDDTLRKHGALIQFTNSWGRRKLAYPVDHNFYGYYFFSEFDCDPSTVNLINRDLELSNEILRHHIEIKVPGLPPMIPFGGAKETLSLSPREREHRGSSGDRNEQTKPNKAVVDQAVAEVTGDVNPVIVESTEATPATETASVNPDELNKKLDEILNNDIV